MVARLTCATLLATANLLWPIPQSVQCVDGATAVSPSFTVSSAQNNTALSAAMTRYQVLYQGLVSGAVGGPAAPVGLAPPAAGAAPLLTMVLSVQDASGDLLPNTSWQ